MGIAAYNRGTRAISARIDQEIAARKFREYRREVISQIEPGVSSDLPTGVLRSTFLPMDTLGGAKLYLEFRDGLYIISASGQTLARRRKYEHACDVYESVLMGDVRCVGGTAVSPGIYLD